ncbi:PREDICTED: uncharacterized protein LOC100634323 [Amphimedon queenslandica]|uniref:Uncharacterized protein n=1 Tax=Amphimedon queenslandica TaxID=400682 RepID=A0A1X7UH95_AMPQE|nr:PREDICTED: uncharacterized protein LOC100634323 [Amphimedon queenslandica]|eukprot:XP_003388042.2 PREDICTED: uncharacterized protein LOC100634323 [Amphimedon queenslandica]
MGIKQKERDRERQDSNIVKEKETVDYYNKMEKEVAEKISSIQEISTNLKQTLSKIKEGITTDPAGTTPGLTPSDIEAISVLPETLHQYSQLLNNLSEEWDKLLLTSDGLGTVTSYDGSVFNPQEVSLVLVIHCIISDMEMLLTEANKTLTAGPSLQYSDAINKIYAVIASMQYMCQTGPAGKDFPSHQFGAGIEKITKTLPDYQTRVEAIGVQ